MNPIRPNTTEKLLTLLEASQKLGVTPEVLLSWNDYQILKPTITVTGQIGYTEKQIEQFLRIYEAFRPLQTQQATSTLPTQAEVASVPLPTAPLHNNGHSLRFISTVFAMCIAVTVGIITQQERLSALLNQFETSYQQTHQSAQNSTSASDLSMNTQLGVSLTDSGKSDDALGKNTRENSESAFAQKPENPVTPTQTPPAVLASNKRDGVPTATIAGAMKALLGAKTTSLPNQKAIQDVTTFASTITRPTGTAIPNSPFDKSGNIAGAPHTDLLAMDYTSPDVLGTDHSNLLNYNLRNQLILIAIAAAGTLLYIVKRPRKKVEVEAATLISDTSPFSEKVLELDQKMDGTVVLYYNNKAYKVSKPELHSDSDQFIERLMNLYKPGTKEMEYDSAQDSLKLTAPLSRLVTRLGFVGVKRDVFFPRTAKHSVLFRKYITREDLDAMKIKVDQIISDLTPIS